MIHRTTALTFTDAQEVECISKGKARNPYEFGVKISITTTHREGFVVGARSMPGRPYDGHTLYEALEQASIVGDCRIGTAVVDKGYRGADVPGVRILRSGQRRGVTRGIRAMIRRRSAIEPTIGHMKSDGKLDRNWLKGTLGDALHAVLCGAGHNIRLLLRRLQRRLRRFCAFICKRSTKPLLSANRLQRKHFQRQVPRQQRLVVVHRPCMWQLSQHMTQPRVRLTSIGPGRLDH